MSALNPAGHGGLSKPALPFSPVTPLIFAALIASYFLFPNHLALATQILVLMIFALSYDLLQGHAGIVSLGHAVFLGLGAYGSAILARWGFTDPLFGLMAGASISALVALVLSPIVVRGSDFTRLLVTLGVASLIHEAANRMRDLTGGADGLADFEVAPLLGLFAFDFEGRTAFLYALTVFAFVYAALWRVTTSPFGLALRGIRENPRRMPAIGSPVARHLAVSYLLSGAIAGVGGALLAQTSRFASLDMLGFERSAEIVMVVTLGGTGHIAGVSIGAAAFGLVKDALSTVSPRYWQLGLGIVLMASVFLARGGIGGLIERFGRFGRRT
ncbi:Branched-chain amino acid ABC transporter permease [Bosea sp. 62]|uniref:branched-chain amino acid ABC transporter permease n=1 Tax=unclassified Bosea (in: a-proteobacteria) TaxID=2653178 RepID=UPI00125BF290|nr:MULTISPECIES: branched-chain amino acid ABC transporter permease [unclassified Bosea (in: a-proteobacteria)]CAD5260826.1 Branched-chain amino acid ABC transporter permease [Bosea sp. 46]CAD5265371.1 Branched-chain amino acid ABC transporter permease [Bosea sp. 21B]CAD5274979.1 Branched-chain amino acid ABC transporter permease [Bosea sp. 7B]VVT59202.1 Branched-chain amino acid transport system permease protein [Bosea sp. EC-HK365B]VXB73312.1 Branched-chain amino acid ABC transporter permeas